jgi:hypothetical protein
MTRMADHANRGNPAGQGMAKAAGWTVFLSMAATSATFQVYHSVTAGRMPWELAALYGVVPLLISVCLLEVITHWPTAPFWAPWAAYAIMGGAMLLSAIATGSVVFRAAPPHMSAVFGVLMDGAALLTVHYLINGPREAAEAAARAAAEEAAIARAEADERTALRAERDALTETLETVRTDLDKRLTVLVANLETARQDAADAHARADTYAEKLAAQKPNRTRAKAPNAGRGKAANAAPNGKANAVPNAAPETEVPGDFDARAEALEAWLANPQITGKDLGALVGLGERWGQLRKTEFAKAAAGTVGSDERS